jgi:hypothetical protein
MLLRRLERYRHLRKGLGVFFVFIGLILLPTHAEAELIVKSPPTQMELERLELAPIPIE